MLLPVLLVLLAITLLAAILVLLVLNSIQDVLSASLVPVLVVIKLAILPVLLNVLSVIVPWQVANLVVRIQIAQYVLWDIIILGQQEQLPAHYVQLSVRYVHLLQFVLVAQ